MRLSSKDLGTNLHIDDLPAEMQACIGGGPDCDPQAPEWVKIDPGVFTRSKYALFPNDVTLSTSASDDIRVGGSVCLPPTNGDGDRNGDVNNTCFDGTAPNRITMSNLRMQNARLELATGETETRNDDGDGPWDDGLLKLYLDTDAKGIRMDDLTIRNDTAEKITRLRAGNPGLRSWADQNGDHFFGVFDLDVPPEQEEHPRIGQLECGDLDVKVDLPVLGLTDVLPGLGEFFLGDICHD